VLRSLVRQRGVQAPEMSTSFVNYHALRDQTIGLLRKAAAGEKKGLDPAQIIDVVGEGGNQPWALDIIRTYGFVPKHRMESTADAFSSGLTINELRRLAAAGQGELRKIKKDAPDATARRQAILQRCEAEVDALLSATLGKLPTEFVFRGKRYTPESFRDGYLQLRPDDLDIVVLTNKPTRAFMKKREVTSIGMKPFAQYNVAQPVLERAVQDTLRRGEAVYVSTNVSADNPHRVVGKQVPAASGICSLAAFKYEAFIPQRELSRHDRVKAGISPANHAMAITGFDPDERGAVRKWLVENSWGPGAGAAGHWHMYEDYFREYVEGVAVPRSVVPAEILARCEARATKKKPEKVAPQRP